nr:MAG TPA: hypothetical protein [Caudoviricetes sp.]
MEDSNPPPYQSRVTAHPLGVAVKPVNISFKFHPLKDMLLKLCFIPCEMNFTN